MSVKERIERTVRLIMKYRAEKKFSEADKLREILKEHEIKLQYHADGSVSYRTKNSSWQHIKNNT